LPLANSVAGTLAHHTEQFPQMTNTLRQQLLLLGQLHLLAVEFDLHPFSLGFLLAQRGPRRGQQTGLLAAPREKRLLALLHGTGLGGSLATDTLQQLIRRKGFGKGHHARQQAERHDGNETTSHWADSLARVLIGRFSTSGACCWRA